MPESFFELSLLSDEQDTNTNVKAAVMTKFEKNLIFCSNSMIFLGNTYIFDLKLIAEEAFESKRKLVNRLKFGLIVFVAYYQLIWTASTA